MYFYIYFSLYIYIKNLFQIICFKTTSFTGPEYNMTQVVLKKKPTSKKYTWINTSLVLVTTVFALVSLAYYVMQIVEKNMKRKANV